MKKLFIFLLILVLIAGGLLTYLGLVPGISKYITKPVDLGIKEDTQFTPSLEQKINFKNELPGGIVPTGREGVFTGQLEINEKITSVAATSILAHWKRRSPSLPIREVQVRFNADSTAEVSGILEISTAISVAKSLGYNDEDIAKGKSYIKYVSGDLPFYVKGTTDVTKNKVHINPSGFQIGKINVPESITSASARVVENVIERKLKQIPSIDLESVKLVPEAIQFKGKVPSTIK